MKKINIAKVSTSRVIGIGASAGGLEPIRLFMSQLDGEEDQSKAFILVIHQNNQFESHLLEILASETALPIKWAEDGDQVRGGQVYLCPAQHDLWIQDGQFRFTPGKKSMPGPSIDRLFTTMGVCFGGSACGVILSGTGHDGAKGAQAIVQAGGSVYTQLLSEAQFPQMAEACIRSCPTAKVVSIKNMMAEIRNCDASLSSPPQTYSAADKVKHVVIHHLQEAWGLDTNWFLPEWQYAFWDNLNKKWGNMPIPIQELPSELKSYAKSYFLASNDTFFYGLKEIAQIKEWLIPYFKPQLQNTPFRAWVPFAGSGEFAYSISLCIQQLYDEGYPSKLVQIFATGIEDVEIEQARKGLFKKSDIAQDLPSEYWKYFQDSRSSDSLEVIQEIKSRIIFSSHSPFSDPPFLHLDLVAAGSFFTRLTQECKHKLRDLFAFSLKKNGLLLTSDPHWIDFSFGPFLPYKDLPGFFILDSTIDLKPIRFQTPKQNKATWFSQYVHQMVAQKQEPQHIHTSEIQEKLFIITNLNFEIIHLSDGLQPILNLPNGPINQNLFHFLDIQLETEVKARITALKNHQLRARSAFRRLKFFDQRYYFIKVRTEFYYSGEGELTGYLIAFDLIPEEEIMELPGISDNLGAIERHSQKSELESLKYRLENSLEELKLSGKIQQDLNTELQLANQQLQQTVEQLASSKEELESSNEELKVAYQELKIIYSELESKDQKLESAHSRLQNLITNSFQPYLQLNMRYEVELFNSMAAEVFRDCANIQLEIGKSLLHELSTQNLESFLRFFHSAAKGVVERGEFKLTDNKNRKRHFYFTASPLMNESEEVEHILYNFLDFSDLNEIKEELEDRNQLIESVFKVVDVGLVVIDHQGIILTCNEAVTKIIELDLIEIIGKKSSDLLHLQPLHNTYFKHNESTQNLYELSLGNGVYKLVQATNRTISLHEGLSMQVISILDISDKIRYLNLLEDTQAAAHVGGWEYDLRTGKFEITDEVKRILPDMPLEELSMEQAIRWLAPESQLIFNKQLQALFNGLIILEEDLLLIEKNNQETWLHIVAKPFVVNGHVRKIIGTVQDITDKKISELELKKLSLVASKTHNAVIITNNKQEIEWVNESFEKMTGFTFEEVMGKNPKLLQGKDTDPEAIKRISEKLSKKEPLTETILNYHKNGTPYWIELTITPVLDEQGKVEKFISIESDVSHEKNIEQQQKHLLRELTRQNQELLRFSYITSHNLRAPLANILGLLNLFDRSHLPTQEDKFVLDSLFESANTLNSTLQDLVESLHHKTEGEKAKTILSMQEAWEHVKRLFTNQLVESNAIIDVHFEHCPYLLWNKNYLYSVLQNLLSNSIKYRKLTESLRITISMEIHNHEPVLNFSDNGQGFDAERYQDRLFGLYQRFNSEVEGKGLGLFIVNSQLKSMGGHIEVWSKPGEGAKFTLYLGKNALPPNHSNHQ